MTDSSASADNTVPAPPEAHDPSLSSEAKDAFFADPPPERHKHRTYDVKARNATEEDADFEADSDAAGEEDKENGE